jgi:hypothetical protein
VHVDNRYPAVLDMEVDFLRKHFRIGEIATSFKQELKVAFDGGVPHAFEAVASLLDKLASTGASTESMLKGDPSLRPATLSSPRSSPGATITRPIPRVFDLNDF